MNSLLKRGFELSLIPIFNRYLIVKYKTDTTIASSLRVCLQSDLGQKPNKSEVIPNTHKTQNLLIYANDIRLKLN